MTRQQPQNSIFPPYCGDSAPFIRHRRLVVFGHSASASISVADDRSRVASMRCEERAADLQDAHRRAPVSPALRRGGVENFVVAIHVHFLQRRFHIRVEPRESLPGTTATNLARARLAREKRACVRSQTAPPSHRCDHRTRPKTNDERHRNPSTQKVSAQSRRCTCPPCTPAVLVRKPRRRRPGRPPKEYSPRHPPSPSPPRSLHRTTADSRARNLNLSLPQNS